MRIFIEPNESLLFRNGRPFTAGVNNFAESLFPPTPETLQGAIRAALAVQWGLLQDPPLFHLAQIFQQQPLVDLLGDRYSYGRFRITGLTLGRRVDAQGKPSEQGTRIERLFPAPSHIIKLPLRSEHGEESKPLVYLHPKHQDTVQEGGHVSSNVPEGITHYLYPDIGKAKITAKAELLTGDWLTPCGLRSALRGDQLQEQDHLKSSVIYQYEPRLGIGMHNESKTTREGYLYQVQCIRMQRGYGFVVDVAFGEQKNVTAELPGAETLSASHPALAAIRSGWLTLGGEQRAAYFTVLADEDCMPEPEFKSDSSLQGNMLYFATPAYFKNGWLPEESNLLPARPITAAINRYQTIGGWALDPSNAGGAAKTTHRCIPAGSVYFFQEPISVTRPVTEYGWQIGYGITYTGEIGEIRA